MCRLFMVSLTALVVTGLVGVTRAAFSDDVVAGPITGTNGTPVPVLEWGPCPASRPEEAEFLKDYQCSTAEMPLSYRDLHAHRLELALGRLPCGRSGASVGHAVWKPGGPGGSGRIPPPFSEQLHQRFDLVGSIRAASRPARSSAAFPAPWGDRVER
jgi:hypothetical protein